MSAPIITLELDYKALTDLDNGKVQMALSRAINRVTDRLRTKMARSTREQINFPASYLAPAAKRLWVAQRAKATGELEAILRGQSRPTSLARFSKQKLGQKKRGGGVSVTVAPGQTRLIKRGFLINLKNDNTGLAVRTNGEKPLGAYKPKKIGKNLWLLYGPSVDQALLAASSGGGIFEDMQVEALDELEVEFLRQLEVLDVV